MGVKVREKVKGAGVWWVFINHNGRRASKMIGTQEAAEDLRKQLESRLALGLWLPQERPPAPKLMDYYKRFTKVYLDTSVRQGTRDRYETSFQHHILPTLGKLPMDHITRDKIRDFIADLVTKNLATPNNEEANPEPKYLARPTIRIIMSQLCALFSHAVEESIIDVNPALRVGKYYKQSKVRHEEIQPLSAAEVPVFLNAVVARSKDYYPVFLAAIHTGLRAGELVGLQWGDIDFNGKFIVVRRCFTRGRIELTKTAKVRRVDMSDALLECLQAHRRSLREKWLKKGENEIPKWVFPNQEGNPLDYYNLKHRHFERCLEYAKLRHIRFHDLRHTFASLLIQNGESLAYVKDQLGHSSIRMTVDVYGHLVPGANRAAVNKLPSLGNRSGRAKAAAKQ